MTSDQDRFDETVAPLTSGQFPLELRLDPRHGIAACPRHGLRGPITANRKPRPLGSEPAPAARSGPSDPRIPQSCVTLKRRVGGSTSK